MTELRAERTDQSGRTHYEPVLTRITGVSQYNPNQFPLEGIDGFWDAGELQVATPVKNGAIAWFTLTEKPKSGPRARPGSKYQDIKAIVPASDEEKASYTAPERPSSEPSDTQDPRDAWGASPNGTGPENSTFINRDQSILRQVGFKAAVELLCAKMMSAKTAYDPYTEKEWNHLATDVWHSYNLVMMGKNPEALHEPEPDESPLVNAAVEMGAQVTGERAE